MELTTIHRLLLAFGLGLLVGLQRESEDKVKAGIRTVPLITVLGFLATLLTDASRPGLLAATMIALALLVMMANYVKLKNGRGTAGMTTEVALLVMFLVGCLLATGYNAVAVVTAGTTAVLLHWKRSLHRFVDRLGTQELTSVFRLALLGLVVLPVLPNETYGPYDVLNPFEIWLIVVLIVGISMAAYVLQRLLDPRKGSLLGGLLGGLISSTATSVTYAKEENEGGVHASTASNVILIASAVVLVRVMIEVAVVSPSSVQVLAAPLGCLFGLMLLICIGSWWFDSPQPSEGEEQGSPSGLKTAITFGLLYALVLVGVAVAKEHLGKEGLFVVAGLSGLTDMDAITLSTARLMEEERLADDTATRMLLISYLANMLFKGVVIAAIGSSALRRRIAILFGLLLVGGTALILVW